MRKILLLTACLLFTFDSYAQFSFGLKAGFTGAYITNTKISGQMIEPPTPSNPGFDPSNPDPEPDNDPLVHDFIFPSKIKIGTYFGIFVQYRFNDRFALQSDVVYSEQGGYFRAVMDHDGGNDREDVNDKIRFKINYINIPVMAKYYFAQGKVSIDAGAQLGIRLDSKMKMVSKKYNLTPQRMESPLGTTEWDLSLALGATYYASSHFDIHARFTAGLTNVLSTNYAVNRTKKNQANNVINLGLGYRF